MRVRPMSPEDSGAAHRVSAVAFADREEERARVLRGEDPEAEERTERFRHLLRTDPGGSWVAEVSGRVVGVAAALRREGLWGLSVFAVSEECRGRGVGAELLRRALGYAEGCRGGLIVASTHPAALRRYALAGFSFRPTLLARGTVRRSALPKEPGVREGGEEDLELAARVDRRVRGATHGPDLEHLLRWGGRMLVCERCGEEGYAVFREGSPLLLAATDVGVASRLLWGVLARAPAGREVEVRWITGGQDWAVRAALDAGLGLGPSGPLCVRGEVGPLAPYLPSGPFL
ncbi:GNAT family N-acetyltransferase [Rubrobacter xylanophilus]|uniref:GNAT family N-acetyltransferase n=1 Tax=Rubrobacter xylanophilus TaxID=49319 RepID=UPI001F2013C0|nr:GNAT family N-acetyltransferase [Rubrobacter xylanophilus]